MLTKLPRLHVSIALMLSAMLAFAALATGCAHNPIAAAETPAQKAYAISASYNVILESAADIVEDQGSPVELRRAVQDAESRTTPVIESLEQSFAEYQVARAEVASGATPADRLDAATANLESWVSQAETALVELATALRR